MKFKNWNGTPYNGNSMSCYLFDIEVYEQEWLSWQEPRLHPEQLKVMTIGQSFCYGVWEEFDQFIERIE